MTVVASMADVSSQQRTNPNGHDLPKVKSIIDCSHKLAETQEQPEVSSSVLVDCFFSEVVGAAVVVVSLVVVVDVVVVVVSLVVVVDVVVDVVLFVVVGMVASVVGSCHLVKLNSIACFLISWAKPHG